MKEKKNKPETASSGEPQVIEEEIQSTVSPAPDPFDPERLRLSQNFAESLGVKKTLITVPARKPSKEWWIRVHPDESYRIETAVLELKEEREIYLIDPALWDSLATEATFGPRALFTAVNRQGVVFLWTIRLPSPDGKIDQWNKSALEAAMMGIGRWIRVTANMSLGAYDVFEATGNLPEPKWPEQSFQELLRITFKDHYIDDINHPVLKRLRGEV